MIVKDTRAKCDGRNGNNLGFLGLQFCIEYSVFNENTDKSTNEIALGLKITSNLSFPRRKYGWGETYHQIDIRIYLLVMSAGTVSKI